MAPKSDKALLLFIHGLSGGGDEGTWRQFPALIEADPALAERYDVAHFDFRTSKLELPFATPIPKAGDVARLLKTEIETKHSSYTQIAIIAHSLGGLIARRYIADVLEAGGPHRNAVDLRVKRLITFATPHIGAELANLAQIVAKGVVGVLGKIVPLADRLVALSQQVHDLGIDSHFQLELRQAWGRACAEHALRTKYVVATADQVVSRTSSEGPQWSDDYDMVDADHFSIVKVEDANHPSFVIAKVFLTDDSEGHVAAPGPTFTQPRLTRPWADVTVAANRFLYAARRTTFVEPVADLTALHAFRGPAKHMFRWMLATGPGGVGKSRTALELVDAIGPRWWAGFFDPTDKDLNWNTWQPVAPTLIIADYAQRHARTREGRVGLERVVQALAARTMLTTPTSLQLRQPVRLLLVERPGDHRRLEDDLKREASSAVRSAIDATRQTDLVFRGLKGEDELWRLIEDVWQASGASPDRGREETLAILRQIDPEMRPLFAMLLVDALADHRYQRDWDQRRLLEDVLRRERERWRAAVGTQDDALQRAGPEERVLALATMTNGISLEDLRRESLRAPLVTWDEDCHRLIFAAMAGAPADDGVPPIVPDIVGESFVLDVIDGLTVTQRSALRDAAWRTNPYAMLAFLLRVHQDAPQAFLQLGQPAVALLDPPCFNDVDRTEVDYVGRKLWLLAVGTIHYRMLQGLTVRAASSPVADQLFHRLLPQFEAHLRRYPEDFGSLAKWGAVLLGQSTIALEAEVSRRMLAEAASKFAAAAAARPDDVEAHINWGVALLKQSELAPHAVAASELLSEAASKFAAAAAARPDDVEAHIYWGDALFKQSELAPHAEAASALLSEAVAKYATFAAMRPNHASALVNWGRALIEQARLTQERESARRLLAEAAAKYAVAAAATPDDAELLSDFGLSLYELARQTPEPRSPAGFSSRPRQSLLAPL